MNKLSTGLKLRMGDAKMSSFSERMGYKKLANELQFESINSRTRSLLWNILFEEFFDPLNTDTWWGIGDSNYDNFILKLWGFHIGFRLDAINHRVGKNDILKHIREYYENCPWYRVYDFLEYIVKNSGFDINNKQFIDRSNALFEKEYVGYRFMGTEIVPITNEIEIREVKDAINTPFDAVNFHIQTALTHLSDRDEPDYRNSIKESISAVESLCKIIIGDRNSTLGQALKRLDETGVELHPALRDGFSKLYGWTSADEGIRHAMMDMSSVDQDDAKYMLITCSAFVNYLLAESNKIGIDLQANWESIR